MRAAMPERMVFRRFLFASTALIAISPAVIGSATLFSAAIIASSPALADGGAGGGAPGGTGGADSATGAGGAGQASAPYAGGGGGAGATGGAGGTAGDGLTAGGAGGAAAGANGADGAAVVGVGGGSGGGGGAHGYVGAALPGGVVTGGNGGKGGDGGIVAGNGAGGGAGGYGAVVTGAGSLGTLTTNMTGGAGGNGGAGTAGNAGGSAGSGGIGLDLTGAATLTIGGAATIQGGNGGVGGNPLGPNASGGAGIVGGGLTLTISGTVAGGLAGDGVTRANAITFTGGANTLTFGNATTGLTGNIGVTGTLTFNQSSVDTTVANIISGTGAVTKSGTALITLTGVNTYTGATTVGAGTLSVNGSIAPYAVTVNNGGTLGGTGTVGGTTVNSGGALAPGNSIGTINVSGNLIFNGGSNYNVEVSPTNADRTNATGTATLAGTVNATYAAGSYVSKQYTILNAAGGVTGTFAALNNISLPGNLIAALSYDANNVYLNLTLFGQNYGSGLNGNQSNVTNALTSYFNSTGGIPTVFANLSPAGLSQVAGEAGTGVQQTSFNAANQFLNAMSGQMFGGVGNGGGALSFADASGLGQRALAYAQPSQAAREVQKAYAAVTPQAEPNTRHWSVWASGYGGTGTVEGDAAVGSNKTTSHIYGAAAGATYRGIPGTIVGLALGGAGTSYSLANGFGGGDSDVFQAGLYARYAPGPAYLAGALAYGWQNASTDRTVTAAGSDRLTASFDAQTLAARIEAGWRFGMPAFGVTPYGAVQSTTIFQPGYSETASSGSSQFALSYASQDVTATRGELGLRFDWALTGLMTLRAKTAWAHDWNTERAATATFQQLPGATFTVDGAEPAADALLVSAGSKLDLGHGWSLAANFDGEFSRTTESYAGRGTVRYTW